MKFDQYEHKEMYGLPRTAKLKGFLVVNEEKEDMLAMFMDTEEILRTAYTKDPKSVMLFHKLALDKEKITSQKIKEALIEIEETYKVIKKKFY